MKVLITCGATWTPIDDVRVISNVSSGEMGHLIAEAFSQKGAKVTLLEGPVTHPFSSKKVKTIKYRYFNELAKLLKKELSKKYDIVVHAAAVSDFSATIRGGSASGGKVKGAFKNKISSNKSVTLKLTPTPKLIKDIKRLNPESFLVGFKLEPNITAQNAFKIARGLFSGAGCDLVVANSLKGGYKGFVLNADGDILTKAQNKQRLATGLVGLLI